MNESTICPKCEGDTGRWAGWRWVAPAALAVAWVFLGSNGLRAVLAPVLALYLGAYLSIAFHEAARSAAAIMSNQAIHRVAIGSIGWSRRFRFGSTDIDLRAVPNVGVTEFGADEEEIVTESLILAAGLVVHFGVLALAGWLAQIADAFYDVRFWQFGVLIGLLLQLAPRDVDGHPTVGKQFATCVTHAAEKGIESWRESQSRRREARERAAAEAAAEAADAERRRRETEAVETLALTSLPVLLTSEPQQLLEAGVALEQMLEDDSSAVPGSVVKNDLARVLLALGDEGDMARAESLTAEAFEAQTGDPVVGATRGAALVAVGRYDEAFSLLSAAIEERTDGFASAFLALAAIRLGKLDVARQAARDAYGAGVRVWALRTAMPRIGRAEATMLVEGFGCGKKSPAAAAEAVVESHQDLSVAIGRAARSWLDHASPSEIEVFQAEVEADFATVRACADLLARGQEIGKDETEIPALPTSSAAP